MSDTFSEFIRAELEQLPAERGAQFRGLDDSRTCWLKCPWHGDGKDNTASLKVNLTGQYVGSWVCFGCFIHRDGVPKPRGGKWSELASKLGMKGGSPASDDEIQVPRIRDALRETLLGETDSNSESNKKRVLVKKSPKFPIKERWRGINGWLLHAIGARVVFDEHGSHVYLPIKMGREWCSGIYCTWDKQQLAYINETDPRIKRALFPYNYVVRLLRQMPKRARYLVLCEGPRDALNLLQYGIPALAVLGGITVWTSAKAEAVAELNPRLVVLAFDPDEVGKALTTVAKLDLAGYGFLLRRFRMHYRVDADGRKRKEDPGNLGETRMLEIKRHVIRILRVTQEEIAVALDD